MQYASVKARDAINRRLYKGLIIVKTAIYRVFVISRRVEVLEYRVEVLKSRVEVLESRVEVLEYRVEVLKSRVEVLESRVEVLEYRVEVLKSRVGVRDQVHRLDIQDSRYKFKIYSSSSLRLCASA